jgi:hypothetical protein
MTWYILNARHYISISDLNVKLRLIIDVDYITYIYIRIYHLTQRYIP